MIRTYCDGCGGEIAKRPDDALRAKVAEAIEVFIMPQCDGKHVCAACVFEACAVMDSAPGPTGERIRAAREARSQLVKPPPRKK